MDVVLGIGLIWAWCALFEVIGESSGVDYPLTVHDASQIPISSNERYSCPDLHLFCIELMMRRSSRGCFGKRWVASGRELRFTGVVESILCAEWFAGKKPRVDIRPAKTVHVSICARQARIILVVSVYSW